ncbi:MAG TPA: glycosyltransferase [Candidatus Dormibacteraeota bacterium]|nr:glycosyltransferase [Candidatus Dormibacteraeota bacterium]
MAEPASVPVRPDRVAMITLHTSPTATLGQSANGGLNVYVRELCTLLSRCGVATDVFTRCLGSDCPDVEELAPLSRVVYLPAGPRELDKYRLLEQVPTFTDAVQDCIETSGLRYDLIYSHYWLSGLTACALHHRLRLPWAHTAHTLALVKNRELAPGAEPEPEIRVDLEGEISRCADLLVVSTEAEGDELRRAYHVAPDRIAVVAPGVSLDTFRPQDKARARAAIGHDGHRLFVFAGRLEPLKGVDVLLRAFARLTEGGRHPEARVLVLGADSGAGGEQARLRRLATALRVADRVEFLGSVPQDRLATYYGAADACLVPSYSESFGLVALEAQACATAVIASNVDGLASIVRDGATGFLVDGHDPADYAERMRLLLETPGLAEAMGRRGTRLAAGFSWQRTTERLLDRFSAVAPQRRLGQIPESP